MNVKKEKDLYKKQAFIHKTICIKMWITFYFCGKEHLFVDKHHHFLWFSFAKASKLSTIYQKPPSYPQRKEENETSKNEKVDKLSTEKRPFFAVRRLIPLKMKKPMKAIRKVIHKNKKYSVDNPYLSTIWWIIRVCVYTV